MSRKLFKLYYIYIKFTEETTYELLKLRNVVFSIDLSFLPLYCVTFSLMAV